MLDRILSLFQHETQPTELPEADAMHAMGALLVRAAKTDKIYLLEEIEQIDELLAHRYKLSMTEAKKLRLDCEVLDAAMPKTMEITQILRDAISFDERVLTILALWEVYFADGYVAEAEEQLMVELEGLLGVSPAKSKELHDLVKAAN